VTPRPRARPRASEPTGRARLAPALLLLAALAVKAVVLAQLHRHPLLQPEGGLDSEFYVRLARQAAGGDWALGREPYFLSPFDLYFLAVVFVLSKGSLLAAKVVQIPSSPPSASICCRARFSPAASPTSSWRVPRWACR
jgi:hypothetical protein